MTKVFIDGAEGTTGLKLAKRLESRKDIKLITIDEDERKDPQARAKRMNKADFVFLCLPDQAAIEATSLVTNEKVKILDTSTAHRISPDWAYGFPELSSEHREKIATGTRIAVPGCYATGMLAILYPLISQKMVPKSYPLSFFGISGYTGGGKKMIAQYEDENREAIFDAPRQYSLTQCHKHLAEVSAVAGVPMPGFTPVVCDYPCGMTINLSLASRRLFVKGGTKKIHKLLSEFYEDSKMIKVMPLNGVGALDDGFISTSGLSGCDNMEIFVGGTVERVSIVARFDNLGKGASGAAIQAMNIMMGIDETTGLVLSSQKK